MTALTFNVPSMNEKRFFLETLYRPSMESSPYSFTAYDEVKCLNAYNNSFN